jgi:hypothetical protein
MFGVERLRRGWAHRWFVSASVAALWLIFLLALFLSYSRISVKSWTPNSPGSYAALVSVAHADPLKPADHLMARHGQDPRMRSRFNSDAQDGIGRNPFGRTFRKYYDV